MTIYTQAPQAPKQPHVNNTLKCKERTWKSNLCDCCDMSCVLLAGKKKGGGRKERKKEKERKKDSQEHSE